MKRTITVIASLFICTACISTRSKLKNVDNNAPFPRISKNNTFVLTEYSNDKKYGYNKNYPINVFYGSTTNETINPERFLNALAGPNGEPISYTKLESCCPFPTKRSNMGAGFLDVYEIQWKGQSKPVILYLNIYERGLLQCPMGLSIRNY